MGRLELNVDIIVPIASVSCSTSNNYNPKPPKKKGIFNNTCEIFLLICNNRRSFL